MIIAWCWLSMLASCWRGARAHGRLVEPPSRASAWRYSIDTPHNYNDLELDCGGFLRQWQRNGGKCGVCGDAWDTPQPRPHEQGGLFYKGVIVRIYAPNDTITIRVELMMARLTEGFFEFRICDKPNETTQDCLDKHVLKINGTETTKYYPRDGSKVYKIEENLQKSFNVYKMKYRLPEGLECAHCVMQWRYITGNNWGQCGNGTGAVGCGPQEEFRACADIAISKYYVITRRSRPMYVPPNRRPTVPTPEESTSSAMYVPPNRRPTVPTPEESTSSGCYGAIIAVVTLLVSTAILAAIYLFYYRGYIASVASANILKFKSLSVTYSNPYNKF